MTILELVKEQLCRAGVAEATSVEIKLSTGETVTISSDQHPVLGRDASEAVSVTPKRSAEGG